MKNPNFNKFVNSVVEKLHLDFEEAEHQMGHYSEILGDIGSAAQVAVPPLINLLEMFIQHEKFDYSCNRVIEALGKIGPTAKEAVPILIELLEKESTFLRFVVVTALGNIGTKSPEVIAALKSACENGDMYTQKASKEALEKLLSDEE